MAILSVPSAVGFWKRMGFQTKGEYHSTGCGCVEMTMEMHTGHSVGTHY